MTPRRLFDRFRPARALLHLMDRCGCFVFETVMWPYRRPSADASTVSACRGNITRVGPREELEDAQDGESIVRRSRWALRDVLPAARRFQDEAYPVMVIASGRAGSIAVRVCRASPEASAPATGATAAPFWPQAAYQWRERTSRSAATVAACCASRVMVARPSKSW